MCTMVFHFHCPYYSQSGYFSSQNFKSLPNKLCWRKIHSDCCFGSVEPPFFGNIWKKKKTPQCFINFFTGSNHNSARQVQTSSEVKKITQVCVSPKQRCTSVCLIVLTHGANCNGLSVALLACLLIRK